MSDERKPLWPWIVALLIGLPVLYVASFGPACWITSHADSGKSLIPVVYRPLLRLMCWKERQDLLPRPALSEIWDKGSHLHRLRPDLLYWYTTVGAREGAGGWVYLVSFDKKNRGEPLRVTGEDWEWR